MRAWITRRKFSARHGKNFLVNVRSDSQGDSNELLGKHYETRESGFSKPKVIRWKLYTSMYVYTGCNQINGILSKSVKENEKLNISLLIKKFCPDVLFPRYGILKFRSFLSWYPVKLDLSEALIMFSYKAKSSVYECMYACGTEARWFWSNACVVRRIIYSH